MISKPISFPDIIQQIRFRYEDDIDRLDTFSFPETDRQELREDLQGLGKDPLANASEEVIFELLNTRLDDRNAERFYRRTLFPYLDLPRRSTYAIALLIHAIVSQMNPKSCYLNVGTWYGFAFFVGMSVPDKLCFGVEDFSSGGDTRDRRHNFYRQFLKQKNKHHFFFEAECETMLELFQKVKIGFFFYNASCEFEDQLKALMLAEPYFDDRCIVMVDDINLKATKEATMEFMNYSREPYKVIFEKSTPKNDYPTWGNGITLLQRL